MGSTRNECNKRKVSQDRRNQRLEYLRNGDDRCYLYFGADFDALLKTSQGAERCHHLATDGHEPGDGLPLRLAVEQGNVTSLVGGQLGDQRQGVRQNLEEKKQQVRYSYFSN